MLKFTDRSILNRNVRMHVTGLRLERVLDCASANGIRLKNITRLGLTELEATAGLKGYERLKKILPKGAYKLKTVYMGGGAGALVALRGRYALLVGLLCAVMTVAVLSQRVWFITVEGSSDPNVIKTQLSGLLDWKKDYGHRLESAEGELIKNNKNLQWASLTWDGVVLKAFVKEKKDTGPLVPKTEPADVVSTKSGTVRSITVLSGTAQTSVGMPVREGDVLISSQTEKGPVHAEGTVLASVWYSDFKVIPRKRTVKKRTGESSVQKSMLFLGLEIPLEGNNAFEDFEVEETRREIIRSGIPLTVIEKTYFELEAFLENVDAAAESEIAGQTMLENLALKLDAGANIEEQKFVLEEKDECIIVNAYIETLENIGKQIKSD